VTSAHIWNRLACGTLEVACAEVKQTPSSILFLLQDIRNAKRSPYKKQCRLANGVGRWRQNSSPEFLSMLADYCKEMLWIKSIESAKTANWSWLWIVIGKHLPGDNLLAWECDLVSLSRCSLSWNGLSETRRVPSIETRQNAHPAHRSQALLDSSITCFTTVSLSGRLNNVVFAWKSEIARAVTWSVLGIDCPYLPYSEIKGTRLEELERKKDPVEIDCSLAL